jgi:hypothetical protein
MIRLLYTQLVFKASAFDSFFNVSNSRLCSLGQDVWDGLKILGRGRDSRATRTHLDQLQVRGDSKASRHECWETFESVEAISNRNVGTAKNGREERIQTKRSS